MDHILGLGFFGGFYRPDLDVHVWGPASTVAGLRERLNRYLSPPLFPVRLRDVPCRLSLHDVPLETFALPGLEVTAGLVVHPGTTVGYRLSDGSATVSYLPDHEPVLGSRTFPEAPRWTSGYALMAETDLLIHDAQYTEEEYPARIGWGHSSIDQAVSLAEAVGARHLVPFHHDPGHDDARLDDIYGALTEVRGLPITPAREGSTFDIEAGGALSWTA
jgi:ribonuclease BN (tRNA processing enzyme)